MSRITKTILIIGIILLIYGYLCRLLNLYFFWDSKTIGWIVLFIALLSYWIDLRRTRRQSGKKTTWVIIGICFLTVGLCALPMAAFLIKTSEAYDTAIEYLKSEPKIKDEIGEVKGFGLIPTGSVQTTTINGAESGSATLDIIVIGNKKNKDITIELKKTPEQDWIVTYIK